MNLRVKQKIRNNLLLQLVIADFLVGVPGLEPGKTGPESVVLPITPYPKLLVSEMPSRIRVQNYDLFLKLQIFSIFFLEILRFRYVIGGKTL